MLTLLEQNEHATGTYFALQPSGPSKIKIEDVLFDLKIPNQENPMEYHTTIIYSAKPCPEMKTFRPVLPIWGTAEEFDLFGPEENILVLRIKSNRIHELYDDLQRFGPITNYPEYKPHITVAKDWTMDKPLLDKPIRIKFDSYVCCALDKD